jgi:triacylglycerol lipase
VSYPIVLAHGIARFDQGWSDFPHDEDDPFADFFSYFRGVRTFLGAHGFRVYHSKVGWADPVDVRADALRENVLQVLQQSRAAKVNLIAHSMGGLDARHMMFRDRNEGRIHEHVASLTTIGTPHRGTSFADEGIRAHGELVDVMKALQIDLRGFRDLTREACAKFDEDPAVRAFEDGLAETCELRAYAGRSSRNTVLSVLELPFDIISEREGDNDGLVPVTSALWDRARESGVWSEVDHLNELAWGDVKQLLALGEGQLALMRRIHGEYLDIARRLP